MLKWSCDFNGWKSLSHQLATFGLHWSGTTWDIIYLICYVDSQEHIIEESNYFMGQSSSLCVTTLRSSLAICFVFNLPRDLTRPSDLRAMWLYRKKLFKVSHQPTKFGGHKHCGSRDIKVLVCLAILQENAIKGSYVAALQGTSSPCQVWWQ